MHKRGLTVVTPPLQGAFSGSDLNVTSLHTPFFQIKLCACAMQDGGEDEEKKPSKAVFSSEMFLSLKAYSPTDSVMRFSCFLAHVRDAAHNLSFPGNCI